VRGTVRAVAWGMLVASLMVLSPPAKTQETLPPEAVPQEAVPPGTAPPEAAPEQPGAPALVPQQQAPQPSVEGMPIRDVLIEGNQRVENGTILSYMAIKPGDAYDSARVDRSLKALYATGLFADVTIHTEGDILVVHVVENPIINRLAFEGNSRLSDETLQQEIQSRPRIVYSRATVERDANRILELYRRGGRFAATVQPKVIQLPENRVDLVFEISEGGITLIEKINFVGNHAFGDDSLKSVIMTKETRWYRFFATDDTYDPDRLSFDRELLRRFYLKNGYADFRVVSAVAELAPNKERFFITFTVEEGKRYKFGKVTVENHLRDLDANELRKLVTTREGRWYDAEAVEHVIDTMTDFAGRFGYAFVDIQPDVKRDAETATIQLTYVINEGRRVYVERINITGNTRTLDKVIRREMRLIEGDAFNTARLRLSQQKIRNLGFFEKVDVTNVPASAPDRTVVNVNVEEKSTGELQIGAGFSTTEGLLGTFSVKEKNFLGRGQELGLTLLLSQRTQQIDLSFTEPYFLDRNVSAGFDIFDINRNNQTQSQFDQDSIGVTLRAGYLVTEPLRQTWHYTIRRDNITNISSTASTFIKDQAGLTTTSEIGQALLFDKRNDRFDPTEGYYIQVETNYAGVGGQIDYFKGLGEIGYFYPFAADWTGTIIGRAGKVIGLNGQNVRISDRFFLGQDSMRGFATSGLGPRDSVTSDALGGNEYYDGTVELAFPVGLPKAFGITGRAFMDAGTVTGIDETSPQIQDTGSLRASIGAGMAWRSPFGPVRVDLGFPIVKEPFDKTELIRFNFGTRF
jgi:outer membrane protein insertion porin family